MKGAIWFFLNFAATSIYEVQFESSIWLKFLIARSIDHSKICNSKKLPLISTD